VRTELHRAPPYRTVKLLLKTNSVKKTAGGTYAGGKYVVEEKKKKSISQKEKEIILLAGLRPSVGKDRSRKLKASYTG